jgi:hypothetical protein
VEEEEEGLEGIREDEEEGGEAMDMS